MDAEITVHLVFLALIFALILTGLLGCLLVYDELRSIERLIKRLDKRG